MNYHHKENMEDVNVLKMCHRTLKQMFFIECWKYLLSSGGSH